jgi:hypothetical protein
MVLAVMAKFFPAPGASDLYCNKPSEYDRVMVPETFSSLVPLELMKKLHETGELELFMLPLLFFFFYFLSRMNIADACM